MKPMRSMRALGISTIFAAALLATAPTWGGPPPPFQTNTTLLENVPPARMRAALREGYRVAPDRRFADALGALYRFLPDGGKVAEVALEKLPKGWAFVRSGKSLAVVADDPDFTALWAALLAHARELAPLQTTTSTAGVGPRCVPFLAPGAWSALEKAERAWLTNRGDAAALGTAASCLVALSVQQLDAMEIGDALPARALAALAAYATLSGADVTADLALIAEAMGYGTSAHALAAGLPADDAVRRYLAQRQQRRGDAAAMAHFRALAGAPASVGEPSLPVLRVRFDADEDRAALVASRDVPYAVLRSLWEHGAASPEGTGAKPLGDEPSLLWSIARTLPRVLRISEEELLPTFERLLARASRSRDGPFVDAQVLGAWYRGYFYSALFATGRHHLDQLSPAQPADAFAERLGLPVEVLLDFNKLRATLTPNPGFAEEFRRWYAAMAALRLGRTVHELIAPLFLGMKTPQTTLTLFEELRPRMLHAPDTSLVLYARSIFWRLDSRPSHRLPLAQVAYTALNDGRLARDQIDLAMRERGRPSSGNRVDGLLRSPRLGAEDLALALDWLEQRSPPPLETLASGYRALAARRPASLAPVLGLAHALERQGHREEARTVLRRWVERDGPATAYDRALATVRIAEIYYVEGKPREALPTLQPARRWQIDRALHVAALSHEALGERAQADAELRALYQSHPWSALAPLTSIELDWRRGRNREAAETLWNARHALLTIPAMPAVTSSFLSVFGENVPPERAREAFDALRARLHPFIVREFLLAAQQAGRDAFAFDLASRMQSPGLGGMEMSLVAYLSLKRLEEPGRAVAWLGERVPRNDANRIAQLAHRRGAPELLWSDIVDPTGAHAPQLWLYRAADARLAQTTGHQPALRKQFAAPRNDFHDALARHLLGIGSESDVFRQAQTPQQHYAMAYFLGLKAESDGRLDDAVDWYRAVMETGIFTSDADTPDDAKGRGKYKTLQWYSEASKNGVLFAPTEFRWSSARLQALRDRMIAGAAR